MPKILIKLRKKWCFGLCDRCVWKYNGGGCSEWRK